MENMLTTVVDKTNTKAKVLEEKAKVLGEDLEVGYRTKFACCVFFVFFFCTRLSCITEVHSS